MTSPTDVQRLTERMLPRGAMVMRQRWERLLFLHWTWDAVAVQRTLPPGLTVDTFEGRAWIGVVPFFMRGVRAAGCPPLPGIANFLELNVRTYVHDELGRPGVWFYSLDCNRWLAVKTARALFHLPYEHAVMAAEEDATSGTVNYRARRRGFDHESRFLYRLAGETHLAAPGSLEFFLIERYTLFAHNVRNQRLFAGCVWHEPYRIGAAEAQIWDDTMLRLAGFDARGRAPDHVCAAETVDVRIFPLKPASVIIKRSQADQPHPKNR